jgi:predicted transcriptional regulator
MIFSSTAWKEARRLQARVLQQKGWKQTKIAEALGVTDGAVSQWLSMLDDQGATALLARPHRVTSLKMLPKANRGVTRKCYRN